jgi:hypothetical protein
MFSEYIIAKKQSVLMVLAAVVGNTHLKAEREKI